VEPGPSHPDLAPAVTHARPEVLDVML
jgi:hypothetical protein